MAYYKFKCQNCGHVFRAAGRFCACGTIKCPDCGSDTAAKPAMFTKDKNKKEEDNKNNVCS